MACTPPFRDLVCSMAYSPIHEFNEDYVPNDEELDLCNAFISYRDLNTPAELIAKARFYGVLKPLLDHKDTAYLIPIYSLIKEAENLIRIDYKDGFTAFLTDNRDQTDELYPVLFHDICRYCAVGCATAFFESELRHKINLNEPFVTKYTPLEYAALHLSYDMTKILLNHGADTNNRPSFYFTYPLRVAITRLFSSNNYVKQLTEGTSIFKLFYIFCLPELKEPLDTIKLLASRTKSMEKIFDGYIVSGRVDLLIILLMAARDHLLVPSTDGGSLETTRIGQYITKELDSNRLQEEFPGRAIKEVLMGAKGKVEILWGAIDVLERYRNSPSSKSIPKNEVPFRIAFDLMNDAGFKLMVRDVLCDDLECMRPNLSSSNTTDLAKKIGLDKHNIFGKPATGDLWFSSWLKPNSQHHQYHTFPAVNSNILKPLETQLSKAVPMKPALHTVLASARMCAPLLRIVSRIK